MTAFKIEDLAELRRMVCETIDRSYSDAYPAQAVEFFKQYHSEANISADALNGTTVIVRENGGIVGTGTLLGSNIRRVFVLPEHQGVGLGGRIMAQLERAAVENGLNAVELDSSLVSIGFYRHLGYVGGEMAFIELENGGRLDYLPMSKRLKVE